MAEETPSRAVAALDALGVPHAAKQYPRANSLPEAAAMGGVGMRMGVGGRGRLSARHADEIVSLRDARAATAQRLRICVIGELP